MSYDYFLYSPREQPVRKEDLKASLEREGWPVTFGISGAAGSHFEQIVSPTGPLENGAVLITCPTDDENYPRFVEAIQQNDVETLNTMLDSAGIKGVDFCGVWWSPFDVKPNYTPDMLESLAESYGHEFVAALQQARTHYAFDVSYDEFYLSVARAIAELVGGMIEDPQEGTVEYVTANGR